MDRRRAAGALLALAACIASSAAAPTASNHTALNLYDEPTEGCYYNFQHYGEGDRIMTNEPCLNCTCHNRMLMCYLRVCPFTKAIGQDCTVEKRADQCCPIVTCPDVPVDLLTLTSTSSPAEYGGTGVGKVDKYGCTMNGKYFPEGAKVPSTFGKPCEHCYCIRNMTTCVMQECTLHVDGCTPIYHKDVCCPVRYFCDHPEDEMPLLDDMTTTERPTPGFLLTTTAPTEAPTTTTNPARRDCIEDDQLYPDGALIKTDKPCEHCYCMKGDIVCVVQECGTPMENEGKNCTSLPPRDGQCCPDTYICEGDELSTEFSITEIPSEETMTTFVPPRRVSVEGSGYRNEPDEIPYTEAPTYLTELEGSGEEDVTANPEKEITVKEAADRFGPTEEGEFIPLPTQVPSTEEIDKSTTEPDKGLNTVPTEILEKEVQEQSKTTASDESIGTTRRDEISTLSSVATGEEQTPKPSLAEETMSYDDVKTTKQTTVSSEISEKEITESSEKLTTPMEEERITESPVISEPEKHQEAEAITKTSIAEEPSPTEATVVTDIQSVSEQNITPGVSESSVATTALTDETKTIVPTKDNGEIPTKDSRRTTPDIDFATSPKPVDEEEKTETHLFEHTTAPDTSDITEPVISQLNTIPVTAEEEKQSTETSLPEITMHYESKVTEFPSLSKQETVPAKPLEEESSEVPTFEKTTTISDITVTEIPVKTDEKPSQESTTVKFGEEESGFTTDLTFRKEEDVTTSEENVTEKQSEPFTIPTSEKTIMAEPEGPESKPTTSKLSDEQEGQETTKLKEATTESIMELSTLAHVNDKEPATTIVSENESFGTTSAIDKIDTTTINPADNEIAEAPAPGRIPGEGDCLLEGTTYKNDSIVPSTNKCHSGCKCVSSIIKCDPIICSPPPEDMDNCQPRYDSPESCCPTYICDHGMETIPPQPQSHITGTESPTPSTSECHGDECERTEDQLPPVEPSQEPDKMKPTGCGSDGCEQVPTLAGPCIDNKCEVLVPPTEHAQPHEIPHKEIPSSCVNPEDCKEIEIPVLCEGDSCSSTQGELCGKEGGCDNKPHEQPHTEMPHVCASEEDCKRVEIPRPEITSCEGETCTNVQQDCSSGECKSSSLQPSEESDTCTEESGCQKPEKAAECENGVCEHKEDVNKMEAECSGDDCMQQQPIFPTQDTAHTESVSTETSSIEETTSRQPTRDQEILASTELPTAHSEEPVTAIPVVPSEQEIKKPEPPMTDEEESFTKTPNENISIYEPEVTSEQSMTDLVDTEHKITVTTTEEMTTPANKVTEVPLERTTAISESKTTETPAIEASTHDDMEIKPVHEETERPEEVTEVHEISTEQPEKDVIEETEKPTEIPKQQYDETYSTELPKSPITEDKEGPIAVSTELPVSEVESESIKPEDETEKTPVSETVTEKLSEKTTLLPEPDEESKEPEIKATEPTIQEPHENILPESSTVSESMVTKTELPFESTSPIVEPTTSAYEKETTSIEQINIEAHTEYITESQEAVTQGKIGSEKSSTVTPERSGAEEEFETSTIVSDVSQPVKTIIPESEETSTKAPVYSTMTDENIPTELVLTSQEVSEPHVVESKTTPAQLGGTDIAVILDITTTPETIEIEKETEYPLPLVTKQPQPSVTTVSVETPEMPTTESQTYQPEVDIKIHEPQVTVSQQDSEDVTKSVTEQDYVTEKTSSLESEKEPSVTEQQEPMTEVPNITEYAKPSVTEQQQLNEVSTRMPLLPETEAPTADSKITEPPTETSEIQEKITSIPAQPSLLGDNVEIDTEFSEPTFTQTNEVVTEEPENEEHYTIIPNVELEEVDTKAPIPGVEITDTKLPTESSENKNQEEVTEIPVFDADKKITEPSQTTEEEYVPVTVALPTIVSDETTEGIPDERVSSEIPVTEQGPTEIPGEFSTNEIMTEIPELQKTPAVEDILKQDHITTISPQLVDTKQEKSSTEKPTEDDVQTKLPEPELAEKDETVTNIPTKQTAVDGMRTTTEAEKFSPVFSETSTTSPKIQVQEEKSTEPPILLTELQETSSAAPHEEATVEPEKARPEQIDTKETTESIQKATISLEEASTTVSVSEDEKQKIPQEPLQTLRPEEEEVSETTPYLVELEEHTHKMDEEQTTITPSEETTDALSEEPIVASSEEPSVVESDKPAAASTEEPTIVSSEEPTVTPSDKPTSASSEQPTIVESEEPTTVSTKEPPISSSEETDVVLSGEPTLAPSEETTNTSSEEPTIASSEEPIIASSEEPIVTSPEEPAIAPTGPSSTAAEEPIVAPSEEPTVATPEETELPTLEAITDKSPTEEKITELPEFETERPSQNKEGITLATVSVQETTETVKPTDTLVDKFGGVEEDENENETAPSTPNQTVEEEVITNVPSPETEKPTLVEEPEKDVTVKPQFVPVETTAPEEEFIPVTVKSTTAKTEDAALTQPTPSTPEEKPIELPQSTTVPEVSKPDQLPTDEVPSPEDESHFPPSGGYNQEPDYVEEDQAFGPGTCRYGGKVYVSAQQIPRDDPCDFCFCFRSDIICLQQSCPPPIHGCHEEPIQGFCCPRYECPVSMATTLNVTTTTTTTTTTLPPHFLPHAYKGAVQKKGCQIKGHTYQVGEVVRASSGPCLHCTCGGDGQMKCDPKQCTPEPMLRQMIAAAVSAKRRR